MTKKFICVQGSPEIPKGTIAEWQGIHERYWLYHTEAEFDGKGIVVDALKPWQVEGNECWEEVKEKTTAPTERWKPEKGQPWYYITEEGDIGYNMSSYWDDESEHRMEHQWKSNNVFGTEQEARDEVKRRESIAKTE